MADGVADGSADGSADSAVDGAVDGVADGVVGVRPRLASLRCGSSDNRAAVDCLRFGAIAGGVCVVVVGVVVELVRM
jgi:hypothetical protein